MAIFNFGRKQKLHTQMYGRTTGKEMFKVDEYNKSKQILAGLGFMIFWIFVCFYFGYNSIPIKLRGFLFIVIFICLVWGYIIIKNQKRLKQDLYY